MKEQCIEKKMFVFAITALGITIIGLAFGDVILSPSSPATIENNPLTLTCNYTGQETVTYFVFKVIKKNQTLFNNIVIINAECNTVVIPVDTNLYEYACPSDKEYSWTIKKVTRQNEGERYQCVVDTSSPGGINSNAVIISIHDPPSVPTFKIHGTTVSGTVKVIRNKTLSISCISSGNPPPSYTWTYPNSPGRPGQVLTINNVQSDTRLTCSVQNTISPTGGANVTWKNSSYIDVEVLYPPKLQGLNNKNIVTGSQLNFSIPYEKGNPQDTTFKWTRNGDNREWYNQILYIENITKLDDMMYTCTVKNEMTPTLSVTEIGEDSKSFHLNVLYKPTITSFAVKGKTETSTITVDENEDITFVCIVDSNPNSSFAIAFEDKVIYRQNNTKTVRYNHKAVICLDTGIYTCSARNQYSSSIPRARY